MTDFYSVLKRSIESRSLKTAGERRQVYDQARKAMIRKLWSAEPRLPEEEIASRIAIFDAAVERIEGDIQPAATGPAALAVPEPKRLPDAVEGYDEEADYAPATARGGRRGEPEAKPAPSRPMPPAAPRSLPPPPAAEEDEAPAIDDDPLPAILTRRDEAVSRDLPAERLWREDREGFGLIDHEDAEADDDGEPPRPRRSLREVGGAMLARMPAMPRMPRLAMPQVAIPRLAMPRMPGKGRRRIGERQAVQILAGVIAFLSLTLIGIGIYIFSPRSSGPAIAEASGHVTREVSDETTAAAIPREKLAVTESFAVFDGADPQVFYSTPDNPIRFDKDADGGFTRVSSTSGAAGARAMIGPGLASRLAGQTIRVTLLARSSKDDGAESVRFSYRSGVARSHWQIAKVTRDYSEIGLVWRVPAQRTDPKGDTLVIEPGIPGDGSGVDIKAIRIDLIGRG